MTAPDRPRLTVVIPTYDEVTTLADVVARVAASPHVREIIVVDDCSTDGTDRVAQRLADEFAAAGDDRLHLHRHARNQGKGAALRTGFAHATSDFVIVQDADLEYDPAEFGKILQPLVDDKADVVYGSRFAGGDSHRVVAYWHAMGNRFLTTLSNMVTNLHLTDMETCYKAFRREILQAETVEEHRFGFEPEITAKLAQRGVRFYEVGISYDARTWAAGKKIGWRDGLRAIWCIAKYGVVRRFTQR